MKKNQNSILNNQSTLIKGVGPSAVCCIIHCYFLLRMCILTLQPTYSSGIYLTKEKVTLKKLIYCEACNDIHNIWQRDFLIPSSILFLNKEREKIDHRQNYVYIYFLKS